MSYTVLARKYRPATFNELVGQEHVMQALVNGLDSGRLHHAYLFTGTRGVGKTTIARILAKCLNCEVGESSQPCGVCATCLEVEQGRFVDLIEVDAASRTKVEDTRELLDNVQYAPTRGKYKVYLIDEVHMLSTHSFNALLKTLEEPPPHVKFLLATTDPQKLPVTILSRCLQFNLRAMSPERIVGHLQSVLQREMIPFEEPALWELARAANGSMRDALSLTDQAIAFGAERIETSAVQSMLGSLDRQYVFQLLTALAGGDASNVMAVVAEVALQSPDYYALLGDMLTLLQRLAVAQAVPDAIDDSYGDKEALVSLAASITAEDVQLYYQASVQGRRDLPVLPDPRVGFEMTLLRMLAFAPVGVTQVPTQVLPSGPPKKPELQRASRAETLQPNTSSAAVGVSQPQAVASNAESARLVNTQPMALSVDKHSTEKSSAGISAAHSALSSAKPVPAEVANHTDAAKVDPVNVDTSAALRGEPQIAHALQAGSASSHAPAMTPVENLRPIEPEVAAPSDITSKTNTPREREKARQSSLEKSKETLVRPDDLSSSMDWFYLVNCAEMPSPARNLAKQCAFTQRVDQSIELVLDPNHELLLKQEHIQAIEKSINDVLSASLVLNLRIEKTDAETPALIDKRLQLERLRQAEASIQHDANVIAMQTVFNATIVAGSIEPQ